MQLDRAIDTAFEVLDKEALSEEMVQLFGAQAPVNPLSFKDVNQVDKICISEDVFEKLKEMHIYTNLMGYKCAYFLFGKEREDGSIFLNNIVYDKGQSKQLANFNVLTPKLANHLEEIQNFKLPRQIIVHGHTCGCGVYSDNFSIQDIATYIMMSDLHPLIRKGVVKTIGGIFNSSGDINFVYYDKHNQEMCKFPHIYLEYFNGDRVELPTYLRGNYVTSKHSR